MKDYAAMSDGQIAEEVAKFIELGDRKQKGEGTLYVKNNVWTRFDPCNNPADAWPIISENKISTMWMTSEKEWCAWSEGDLGEGAWYWENSPDYYFSCTSQLRAAMIVFLMMKESEND